MFLLFFISKNAPLILNEKKIQLEPFFAGSNYSQIVLINFHD